MTESKDLSGTSLINIAMRLAIGEKVDVEYSTVKGARNAANGASNKRLVEGLSGIVIKRWTSFDNRYFVTVGKVGAITIANAPVLTDFENGAVTDAANRSLVKMLLEDGFTTMDILSEVENWTEERTISEIEAIKLTLAEQPEM